MITRRDLLRGAMSPATVGAGRMATWTSPPGSHRRRLRRFGSAYSPSLCRAPQFVAEDLLRGEGFTERDVHQVGRWPAAAQWPRPRLRREPLHHGVQWAASPASSTRGRSDRPPGGDPRGLLRAVRDPAHPRGPGSQGEDRRRSGRGKRRARLHREHGRPRRPRPGEGHRVGRPLPGGGRSRSSRRGRSMRYMGFPPDPQELRARKIGHVVVNSTSTSPGRSTSAA